MNSKLIIITFLFIFYATTVAAQLGAPASNGYYSYVGYGNGSHNIFNVSLNHINKRGFSVSLHNTIETRNSKNVPPDYEPGWMVIFGDGIPNVTLTTGTLMLGKVLEDKSRLFQFDLRGGICYGAIERPVNFVKKSSTSFFFGQTTYYEYEIKRNNFIGLVVNPTVNLNVTKYVGFSAGIRSNINAQTVTMGAEFGLMLGFIRTPRQTK